MPTYLVELECLARELYVVQADSAEEAAEQWDKGDHYLTEVTSVEGVTSVREEEE